MKHIIRDEQGNSEITFDLRLQQYRQKPVVIFATQMDEEFEVETLEGTMRGNPGDWLICGVKNEFYPRSDEVFQLTYEPVEEDV